MDRITEVPIYFRVRAEAHPDVTAAELREAAQQAVMQRLGRMRLCSDVGLIESFSIEPRRPAVIDDSNRTEA